VDLVDDDDLPVSCFANSVLGIHQEGPRSLHRAGPRRNKRHRHFGCGVELVRGIPDNPANFGAGRGMADHPWGLWPECGRLARAAGRAFFMPSAS